MKLYLFLCMCIKSLAEQLYSFPSKKLEQVLFILSAYT